MTVYKGIYRHYKGFLAYVHGIAMFSDNFDTSHAGYPGATDDFIDWRLRRQARFVVYTTNKSAEDGVFRIRSEKEFEETLRSGQRRFQRINDQLLGAEDTRDLDRTKEPRTADRPKGKNSRVRRFTRSEVLREPEGQKASVCPARAGACTAK